jgi:NAD+ kinase
MANRKSLPRLVVFGDPKKGPVAEAIEEFAKFARGKAQIVATYCIDNCTAESLKKSDFAVVFGGDGSIISAARNLSDASVPVIGVNLGKLGFLAEFSVQELEELFDEIVTGKAPVEKRMMLGCRIFDTSKRPKNSNSIAVSQQRGKGQLGPEKFCSKAVNDVYITAGPPFRMIELSLAVDGHPVASCVSDGLIVSTPTGSTAYNLSAGGPILAGSMEAMVITPICPHSLSFRPIVISADSVVEVFGVRANRGTTVSIDGQVSMKLSVDDVVRVEKDSSDFLVVNNPLRTRWGTLATKLSWAEKPRYAGRPPVRVGQDDISP